MGQDLQDLPARPWNAWPYAPASPDHAPPELYSQTHPGAEILVTLDDWLRAMARRPYVASSGVEACGTGTVLVSAQVDWTLWRAITKRLARERQDIKAMLARCKPVHIVAHVSCEWTPQTVPDWRFVSSVAAGTVLALAFVGWFLVASPMIENKARHGCVWTKCN